MNTKILVTTAPAVVAVISFFVLRRVVALAVAAAVIALAALLMGNRRRTVLLLRVACGLSVGVLLAGTAALREQWYLHTPRVSLATDGPVIVTGRIVDDLRPSAEGIRRLTIAPSRISDRRGWHASVTGRLVVLWDGAELLLLSDGLRRVMPIRGDSLVVATTGTDFRRGIVRVQEHDLRILPDDGPFAPVSSLRRKVRLGLQKRFIRLEGDSRAMLTALLLGDRSSLDPILYENVRRSGAAHVLALSGMHLGVLALLLRRIFRYLLPPRTASMITVSLLAAYVWVAGPIPSLLRALSLVVVTAVAIGRGNRIPGIILLARAVLLLLLIDPAIGADLGFQYSVCALAGLFILAPVVITGLAYLVPPRLVPVLAPYAGASIAAILATAPLSLHHFGTLYLSGILFGGILSAIVVVEIWLGLLYAAVATVPILGTGIAGLIRLVTRVFIGLAKGGAVIPPVVVQDSGWAGGLTVVIMLLAAIVVIVLLLRRDARSRNTPQPQLDF